ncbi:FHA domain-containing protein [Neorhizobium galegae]|uniref:FHA domain-containing protein n=1 Tax=Neorhizobium galegae TaxID=399 RepID=UPI000621FD48|nr:FHA domain-containing protein [Neorhizobium galegae]CDZ56629.1 Putative transmembrane protein [Neorhizobium galegae bv. orientalis]KAB1122710.1 FHA domain-containing protein [Neorhizobium galegae]MCQ1570304.1 FHA domain-containing protein [Neorhizobium galegae]MCQ1807855.1 FHA domain-containing protein [Neorhizobium galegae]CDZ64307.1 Putative transmembrane protein [Neorhizobium galegae bv. orientalis]
MAFSFFSSNKPSLLHVGANRTYRLDKPELTIGRAPTADIVIDDPFLAPIHARIEKQADGGFVIRRMGLNPIVLRGEALLQTASLRPGDSFRLGKDVEFQLIVKGSAKEEAAEDKKGKKSSLAADAQKPLLKRPAFLAAVGVIYLGIAGAVAITIFSPQGSADGGVSAERVRTESARILSCVKNARKLHQLSQASFKGAVGTGPVPDKTSTYSELAASATPSDDATLAKTVAPLAEHYKQTALAALTAEVRGDKPLANALYQSAYDIVPDITCSAARFAMQRRAATAPPPARR